ncbi:capsular associated protein [Blastomyces gilchristii SLH14081]|uniref:Capsular associated protein n=1 Tax=Blastomyces gilchristii (strain SLH14081) TaxID=559298 RepID=A0A179V0S2_BLAGS|nr:capsular associated protein [Blastomyces gilchristii SLH14081]OAT13936.1 capsular associated protein [Blastomyces gilchristii SLH14081]
MDTISRGTIKYTASTVFIISVSLLKLSAESSLVFDRPAHTAAITSALSGLFLLVFGLFVTSPSRHPDADEHDDSIPLSDSLPHSPSDTSKAIEKLRKLTSAQTRKASRITWLAICALALRIEVSRHIVHNAECLKPASFALTPLLLSIYGYWANRRANRINNTQGFDDNAKRSLASTFPILLLITSAFLTSSMSNGWKSTYICPLTGASALFTALLQILGLVLDTVILIAFSELGRQRTRRSDGRRVQTTVLWGFVLIGVSVIWLLAAFPIYLILPKQREWLLQFSLPYIGSVMKLSLLFTCACVSASYIVTQIRILGISFLFSFTFVCISQLSHLWTAFQAFPVIPVFTAGFSIILLHVSGYWYWRSSTATDQDRKKQWQPRSWIRLVFLALIGLSFVLLVTAKNETPRHPIDTLISRAKTNFGQWVASAKSSQNLQEAVAEYQRRYKQHPPPGFDLWYKYATERSSAVIDDYDQIYEDLLPFRALSPRTLRELTNAMASHPSNDMATVSVRGGTTQIQESIVPTHRWMVEGVAKMINPFSQFLPDMDLAFNLNDECRVAVPWEKINALHGSAKSHIRQGTDKLIGSWSENRASTWELSESAKKGADQLFTDASFQQVYDLVGRSVCPPSSMAKTSFVWDKRNVCLNCARPHSLEQFLSDWTLASDICHQPDLAYLSGFYLSPSAFRVSQSLLPVFSQSKVSGFNDILYPSSWNYIDKVIYRPTDEHPDAPYSEKQSTLFWRGTTSEGYSSSGQWKGMTRQRIVHLANNHTSNSVSILLPSPSSSTSKRNPTSYTYTNMPASEIPEALDLQTSIYLAGQITRCSLSDCVSQKKEFSLGPSTDFQEHWKYRFLMDADGAGFSGRFLPFLQSRSLPFRTGLFRQWLDSRLTAWHHFVPIDIRLHGLWSTLAYFSGAREAVLPDSNAAGPIPDANKDNKRNGDGDGNGNKAGGETKQKPPPSRTMWARRNSENNNAKKDHKNKNNNDNNNKQKILMEPHTREGEFIAEEGRKWAEKALRKEDMEIYMFRLLLEWGRLTDDKRDQLGFQVG